MLRRRLVLLASLAALGAGLLIAGPAAAHPRHHHTRGPVWFEARPQVVFVTPGLEVVVDYDEEVFVYAGWWWTRHDGRWFRAAGWDAPWYEVRLRQVPRNLRSVPLGRYRHYRPRNYRYGPQYGGVPAHRPAPYRYERDRHDYRYDRAERRAERREDLRDARRHERKAVRQEVKADRHRDLAREARADGRWKAAQKHAKKARKLERKADKHERKARKERRHARR